MTYSTRTLLGALLLVFGVAAQGHALPMPNPPSLRAKSDVLIDAQSGQVLAAKKPDKHVKPASVTKLMVAYITFDEIKQGNLSPKATMTVTKKAWEMHGSQMYLRVGNKVSVGQLLKGLMTDSGNDAAVQLAQYIGGSTSTFVGYMNNYLKRLGLKNSHFSDVDGLPIKDHYMSARDMAQLLADITQKFPKLYQRYFSIKQFTWNGIKQYNRCRLLWSHPRVDGCKTGHNKAAGYNLVASSHSHGIRLVAAVTGTGSNAARNRETDALLNYGFRYFRNGTFVKAGQSVTQVQVWKGDTDNVPVVTHGKVVAAYPRGHRQQVNVTARLPKTLVAPIKKGKKLGTLTFKYGNQVLKRTPLYAGQKIGQGSLFSRLVDDVLMMF